MRDTSTELLALLHYIQQMVDRNFSKIISTASSFMLNFYQEGCGDSILPRVLVGNKVDLRDGPDNLMKPALSSFISTREGENLAKVRHTTLLFLLSSSAILLYTFGNLSIPHFSSTRKSLI